MRSRRRGQRAATTGSSASSPAQVGALVRAVPGVPETQDRERDHGAPRHGVGAQRLHRSLPAVDGSMMPQAWVGCPGYRVRLRTSRARARPGAPRAPARDRVACREPGWPVAGRVDDRLVARTGGLRATTRPGSFDGTTSGRRRRTSARPAERGQDDHRTIRECGPQLVGDLEAARAGHLATVASAAAASAASHGASRGRISAAGYGVTAATVTTTSRPPERILG